MTLLFLWTATAWGWKCLPSSVCTCNQVDGASSTWHRESGSFTAAEVAEIEAASNAWDAGVGLVNRGAEFDFVRGSDQTNVATQNGDNEIYMRDGFAWFVQRGYPITRHAQTVTVDAPPCTSGDSLRIEADIVFNDDISWSTDLPSQATSSQTSIGQVAVHEFGHYLGFDHEQRWLGTMNSEYPMAATSPPLGIASTRTTSLDLLHLSLEPARGRT